MHSKVQHRECPRCGSMASTSNDTDFTHSAAHGLLHGFQHHNPIMFGLGALAACAQLFKSVRYYCGNCGHEFFSR